MPSSCETTQPRRGLHRLSRRLKTKAIILKRTVIRDPLTIIVPCFVLITMLGLGLWGLFSVSVATAESRRQVAYAFARDMQQNLQTHIEAAVTPATTMMTLIKLNPEWSSVNRTFFKVAASLINAGRQTDAIITVMLGPQGVIRSTIPDNLPNWNRVYGLDLLRNRTWRPDALKAVTLMSQRVDAAGLVMTGPRHLLAGPMGIVARQAVFINNVSSDETFNMSDKAYDCGPCFVPATNISTSRKFWGFVQLAIDWEVLTRNVTGMYKLCGGESGIISFNMTYVDSATSINNSIAQCGALDSYPVCINIDIMANHWVLCISTRGGWQPDWHGWVMAVIIVTSVLVAIVISAAMMNHRHHMWLLQAALPGKVIDTLSRGDHYVEAFDNVTILFCDIVAYTVMASQMQPMQVVHMLGRVYNTFDELVDEYGCFKVETIGDAFMVVAGIQGETPSEAAAKIARLALAMHTCSGRLGVQFRFGLHSGPVIGAVVGFKMPHFCLFGDTVNVASRMESHGLPMKIHISATCAILLLGYAEEVFVITNRGETDIKGKGAMRTCWLEPMGPAMPLTPPASHRSVDLRLFQT